MAEKEIKKVETSQTESQPETVSKEMFDNLSNCKYRDCLHFKEDGCYIKNLVEEEKILSSRYVNYLSFLKK